MIAKFKITTSERHAFVTSSPALSLMFNQSVESSHLARLALVMVCRIGGKGDPGDLPVVTAIEHTAVKVHANVGIYVQGLSLLLLPCCVAACGVNTGILSHTPLFPLF